MDGLDPARIALQNAKADARHRRLRSPSAVRANRHRGSAKPLPLRGVLVEMATRYHWPAPTPSPAVVQWAGLMGPELARHLVAVGFEEETKTLLVHASSKAWATQDRLLAPTALKLLNTQIGPDTVRAIRLTRTTVPAQHGQEAVDLLHHQAPADPMPYAGEHIIRAGPREDLQITAAVERQARSTPREPEHPFGNRAGPGTAADRKRAGLVHARAVARARRRTTADGGNPPPPAPRTSSTTTLSDP